jgi:hypothetical protein
LWLTLPEGRYPGLGSRLHLADSWLSIVMFADFLSLPGSLFMQCPLGQLWGSTLVKLSFVDQKLDICYFPVLCLFFYWCPPLLSKLSTLVDNLVSFYSGSWKCWNVVAVSHLLSFALQIFLNKPSDKYDSSLCIIKTNSH